MDQLRGVVVPKRIGTQSQYFRTINKTRYVRRYSVAHSRNHRYNGNATVSSLFIAIGVDVAVNNISVHCRHGIATMGTSVLL